MNKFDKKELAITIASAIVAILITLFLSFNPNKNGWTVFFAQLVNAVAIVLTAYFVARFQSRRHSEELVQQRATLSLRRVLTLIENVKQFNIAIDSEKVYLEKQGLSERELTSVEHSLETLRTITGMNLYTTNDIIKDWADLIPKEIEKLEREVRERSNDRESN